MTCDRSRGVLKEIHQGLWKAGSEGSADQGSFRGGTRRNAVPIVKMFMSALPTAFGETFTGQNAL